MQNKIAIGMRWGIKKGNASGAYAKASKKLNKLDQKTSKKLRKAVPKRYGVFGSNRKYQEAKAKADRTAYKTKKWFDKMNKEFSKQSVVKISKSDAAIGEKYTKYFNQNADFGNSTYNSTKRW